MEKKSQSATELALVFVFALFFFSVFVAAVYDRFYSMQREDTIKALKDVQAYLEKEIGFAITSSPGYQREFNLPFKLLGKKYKVDLKNAGNISILAIYYIYSDISPATTAFYYNVSGSIQPGMNIVYRGDDYVIVSPED